MDTKKGTIVRRITASLNPQRTVLVVYILSRGFSEAGMLLSGTTHAVELKDVAATTWAELLLTHSEKLTFGP